MIRALCHAAIAALFACALAACGQKGPLKMPDPKPAKPAQPAPAKPAEAAPAAPDAPDAPATP